MMYWHGAVLKCALDVILLNLGDESSFFRYWFAKYAFKIKLKFQILIIQ